MGSWRVVWRSVLFAVAVSGCTMGVDKPIAATQPAEPNDLERYYPILPHRVRWYAVKDVKSGAPIDFISFAVIAKETSPDGGLVYLEENRFASGISVDYRKVTSEQVQLERLVLLTRDGRLKDIHFAPALPILRAPVKVGLVWSESPRGSDQPFLYRVESQSAMHVLGKDIQDCVRVVRTHVVVDRKTDYCPGVGIAAFETLIASDKWLRAELVAVTAETDLIAVKSSARAPGGLRLRTVMHASPAVRCSRGLS